MVKNQILAAVDLGTDKTTVLVTSVDEKRQLQVLGISVVPSAGMKKSQIIDIEKVIETLSKAFDAAERMAGMNIDSALVSISGSHISSQNSKGVVAVAAPNQEITQEDVDRVLEAARAVSVPPGKEIIHVIPKGFTVDSQTGIKDPVGMTGIRLESEAHIITALSTAIKNTEKCMNDVNLTVSSFAFAGFVAAQATLSETEKELGVVAVDIGAGTTSICAYVDGALAHSAILPIGARHITQDIALGCRISLGSAEKIKLALSKNPPKSVVPKAGESKESLRKRRQEENDLDLAAMGIEESMETLSKKTIIEAIMFPRMKEIFSLVSKELHEQKLTGLIPAGLVLSGGGAETIGMVETAKRVLNLPARVGKPVELPGITQDLTGAEFATAVGLILYGRSQLGQLKKPTGFNLKDLNINLSPLPFLDKAKKLLSSLLP